MRTKRMSWIVGIGALALALMGWMLPRRKKTRMQKMMNWGLNNMSWMKGFRLPMSSMAMKTGMRMVKGMIR